MSKHVTFDVQGMTCDNCVQHVTKAVQAVGGVSAVSVSLSGKAAVVDGDFDDGAVIEAIEEEGYEATVRAS